MEVFSRRKVQRYLAYFFAWTVFGFFNFSRELTRRLYWHEATHWQETLASWMVGVYITAALTPVVLWLGRRWPIERQTWRTRVPAAPGVKRRLLGRGTCPGDGSLHPTAPG